MKRSSLFTRYLPIEILWMTSLFLAAGPVNSDDALPVLFENQIITAENPAPDDVFGYHVAIDGATAAISKGQGGNAPAVYLYQYTGSGWQFLKQIPQPDGANYTSAPGVALDGDTLLISNSRHDGTDECNSDGICGRSGLVYVFERNAGGPGNWGQVATLDGGNKPGAQFGSYMAIDGSNLAVAASSEDTEFTHSGAIYLFERQPGPGGQWTLLQRLEYDQAGEWSLFGAPVALVGDTMVTGIQPTPDGTKVLVYERQEEGTGFWALAQELTFPERRLYETAFDGQTLLWIDQDEQDGSWSGVATYQFFERNLAGTWESVQSWQERLAWLRTPSPILKGGWMLEMAQDGINAARLHARDPASGQWAPVANLGTSGIPLPDWQNEFAISGELALIGTRSESTENQGEVLAYDFGLPINFGHAGAWFDPDTSGQGILVDVDPSGQYMFLSWFTYTDATAADPGEQHWYTAQGPYTGSTAALTLHESLGGSFVEPGGVGTEPVGEFVIDFADCDRGMARYRIDTLGLAGDIPLQRLIAGSENTCNQLSGAATEATPINAGMDGAWYDDTMAGQGFLVDAHQDGVSDYMFVSWFTYGSETESGQRWLTAQGGFDGETADLVLHETTGGLFDDPKTPETVPVGTLTVEFSDCGHAHVDYDLPGETLTGSVDVIRLLSGAAEFCESAQ